MIRDQNIGCPQLVVALAIDGEGFVLGHRIYKGNTSDSVTLVDLVSAMQKQFPDAEKPTVIVDGGISSKENLSALKAAGFDYLVACRRQQYEDVFAEAEFTPVAGRDKRLAVSVYAFEEDDDMLLCCRSEGRAKKEQAIHGKAIARFETDLEKLNVRLSKGRLKATEYTGTYNSKCESWANFLRYALEFIKKWGTISDAPFVSVCC